MPFGWHQPNGMCPCAMRLLQPAEIDHQRRDVAGAQAYDEDVGVDAQVLMPGLARARACRSGRPAAPRLSVSASYLAALSGAARLAGKPLISACFRITASSFARSTQKILSLATKALDPLDVRAELVQHFIGLRRSSSLL